MTTTQHPLVIGVFRDHTQAARAIDELHSAGFLDNKIRVKKTATVSGLLDPQASNLIGNETESRTLPDELVDKGMHPDEADYYQQEFEAGHSVVIVESYEHQQEARAILEHQGAYDASSSWTETAEQPTQGSHHNPNEQKEGDRIIPVLEEVLQAHKQWVQIGEVVLRKEVITEEKTITVPVSREELIIERLPTSSQSPDQPVVHEGKTLGEVFKNGEILKIVLHQEEIRVEKYPVVKEEVFITKRQIEETKHFSDTLKREEIRIEHEGNVHIHENDGDTA